MHTRIHTSHPNIHAAHSRTHTQKHIVHRHVNTLCAANAEPSLLSLTGCSVWQAGRQAGRQADRGSWLVLCYRVGSCLFCARVVSSPPVLADCQTCLWLDCAHFLQIEVSYGSHGGDAGGWSWASRGGLVGYSYLRGISYLCQLAPSFSAHRMWKSIE